MYNLIIVIFLFQAVLVSHTFAGTVQNATTMSWLWIYWVPPWRICSISVHGVSPWKRCWCLQTKWLVALNSSIIRTSSTETLNPTISLWESADTVTNFSSLITDWPRNSGTTVPVNTLPIGQFNNHKVHIFWEGHKILRNLYLTFVCMYCRQK